MSRNSSRSIAGSDNAGKSRMLMLALILITVALISISSAHAALGDAINSFTSGIQGGVSKWKYTAINGSIIAAFLLLVLAFYSDKLKDEKQRMLVQAIVLIFSFAIAFTNEDLKAGYLWKIGWLSNFLHLKVIVNIALITAVVYFIASFFDLQKRFGSKETLGQTAILLFAFIFAATIALAPFEGGKPYDDKTYKYIWQEENVIQLRYYLLGDSNCILDEKIAEAVRKQEVCACR